MALAKRIAAYSIVAILVLQQGLSLKRIGQGCLTVFGTVSCHTSPHTKKDTSRGWVVQEELLPPAVAYFGQKDIFWICHHGAASEITFGLEHAISEDDFWNSKPLGNVFAVRHALQSSMAPKSTTTQITLKDKIIARNSIAERYNACDLTFESDKLIALSGLAYRMCKSFGWKDEDYLAGLWKPILLECLCWRPLRILEASDGTVECPRPYLSPTWSWTSIKGPILPDVLYVGRLRNPGNILADVIDAEVSTAIDAFGKISAGHLNVKSFMWELSTDFDCRRAMQGGARIQMIMMSCGHFMSAGSLDSLAFLDVAPTFHGEEETLHLFFMARRVAASGVRSRNEPWYYRLYLDGLLLEFTGNRKGEYRRVGTARFPLCNMVHGPCSGHELEKECYLDRQTESYMTTAATQAIIQHHLKMEENQEETSWFGGEVQELWTEAVQSVIKSVPKWERVGNSFWPATDLKPPQNGIWQDPKYTIRIE